MKFIFKYLRLLVFVGICLPLFSSAQAQIPPKSNRLVNDYAGVLTSSQIVALENEAVAFDNKTSTQIAIVTIKSLEGRDIAGYSQELAETWGIGQQGKDNGILILIAVIDHKTRIHTGRGITGYASASRLGVELEEKEMNPHFKKGDFYTGLSNGLTQLEKLLDGKYEAVPKSKRSKHWTSFLGMAIIIIIIIISSIRRNRKGGGGSSGLGAGGLFFLGGSGGWGGGSSGGGGGFGGFGGGSFGGGGASSSW